MFHDMKIPSTAYIAHRWNHVFRYIKQYIGIIDLVTIINSLENHKIYLYLVASTIIIIICCILTTILTNELPI